MTDPELGDSYLVWTSETTFDLAVRRMPVTPPGGETFQHHEVVVQSGVPGVVVVARSGGSTLLVRIFRPLLGRQVVELPRGLGESGDAVDDGVRELREETGYVATSARHVGTFVLDSGLMATRIGVVVAEVDRDQERLPGDGEIVDVEWTDDVGSLVRDGVVSDGISLSALAIAQVV